MPNDRQPRPLFFAPRPQHRCIAAREIDLAESAKTDAAAVQHATNAIRHLMLAEAEKCESLLILR